MKSILLTLSILLLSQIPARAVRKIEAHPINIAVSIVENTDSAKLASFLEYYGYQPQGIENGYQIMKDANGNEIRYTFTQTTTTNPHPIVTVKTTDTYKLIDSRLKELRFKKSGNSYERINNQYSKFKTRCSFGPQSTLILHRIQN